MIWLQFLISSAVIVLAAMQLAKFADAIALRSGLGRLFIGAILLASATSMPELLTGLSSFRQGVPNLTVGNLMGSNLFNIVLLALADIASREPRMLRMITKRHAVSGSLTLMMIALMVFFLAANIDVSFGWVGLDSLILIAVYVGSIRLLQGNLGPFEPSGPEDLEEMGDGVPTLRNSIIGFALATAVLGAVSPMLVSSSAAIAEATGLGTSFVGTTLVAISTSLPEVVTTIQLVRIGADDMAVGNLFGSNMFNMFLLGALDFFYTEGRLIGTADPSFVLVGLLGMVMNAIALVGNVAKLERRIWIFEIDATLLLFVYILGLAFLYSRGIAL